jgi:hypothetical protein
MGIIRGGYTQSVGDGKFFLPLIWNKSES